MKVAIAASGDFLELDDGWPGLRDALLADGLVPRVAVWDDPDVDWAAFGLVVAMYTWGYVTRRAAFLAWAERVGAVTRLANTADHLRWNSDKTYLADLGAAGLPVVPTSWVAPGQSWEPPGQDYVVKPTVASGGLGAARYRTSPVEVADGHVRRLHRAGHTVMVQPYQRSIDAIGETALVFLGDRFSHAVNKAALLAADAGESDRLWEREVITSTEASPGQRDLAEAVLAAVVRRLGPTAYARIDLVEDDGAPRVLEVELVEPTLFLADAQGSSQRLAGVLRRLTTPLRPTT
ncbi:MAG: ATP-grasp domain-containing protein [Streptosporangiaceae bacterium]